MYLRQLVGLENECREGSQLRGINSGNRGKSLKVPSIRQKGAIFKSCLVPVLTCGAQVWALEKDDEHKIEVTSNSMGRVI